MNAAAGGVPIVVLHHSGGAAEKLGLALQARYTNMPSPVPSYSIPEYVNIESFLLLSTSSDSVEKVIDKLTLVLSTVQDDEMREVGYQAAERKRIMQAWELYVT